MREIKVGDEVSVDFMGKVISISISPKGKIIYGVDGSDAYARFLNEDQIIPIPLPESEPCKV